MILECKSCQKKFIVPDNAITKAGRLVQCSSCGNKWTQFPVVEKTIKKPKNFQMKKETIKKPINIQNKIKEQKIFSTTKQKKNIVKKKTGPSIYSKEYLKKKHGININGSNVYKAKNKTNNKISKSYFGFYSYLIILLFLVSSIIGILNLTKEIIIFYLPFTEIYIEYLFENLNYFGILFRDALNIY